jgi:hypothetical protein
MATVTYTRSYSVDTIIWDGTNLAEIVALCGANAVEQVWNPGTATTRLRVFNTDISIGEAVAVIHGTTTPPGTGRKYVPGDPEYSL